MESELSTVEIPNFAAKKLACVLLPVPDVPPNKMMIGFLPYNISLAKLNSNM